VDARGVPLSIVASGANTHDVKLLGQTLDGIVVARPQPDEDNPQHICANAGYVGKDARDAVTSRGYRPHIRGRNQEAEEKQRLTGYKPRRWVVERSHSWFNGYRKILVSFEKSRSKLPGTALSDCRPDGLEANIIYLRIGS
jgi:putative transposase